MLAYVYSVNDPRVLDLHYLELMKTLIGVHWALLMWMYSFFQPMEEENAP
jgi:hypothetical protein